MENVAEVAIYHVLYELPEGSTHITPDGKKLYFIRNRKLVRVDATAKIDFNKMDEIELTAYAKYNLDV